MAAGPASRGDLCFIGYALPERPGRMLKKAFPALFNVACEKRGFRGAPEIKRLGALDFVRPSLARTSRLLKKVFQQPAGGGSNFHCSLTIGRRMLKHNTYFEGRVQSVGFERNGQRATVGVIAAGEYHFNTAAAERMSVISGQLNARLPGAVEWQSFPAGTYFEVPANAGFDVQAVGGSAAYLCEFLG
jgi:uncharacterized protein YaiE (UPF0345 family)